MKKCPNCNEEYGDGATYCEKCGTKLIKYRTCPHCHENVLDDAIYCPKCGKALDYENEPTNSNIIQTSGTKLDSQLVEQYKREIVILRSRRKAFLISGLILTIVGFILMILFIVLAFNIAPKNPGATASSQFVGYFFLAVLSELIMDAGIVFLIIQGAVFARKISNRERAIQEYENR